MTDRSWTASELRARLDAYEQELRAAGKARNTINTYVQHPERFINWLEGSYAPRMRVDSQLRHGVAASKYDPLFTYLRERRDPVVRLTFAQIETILGAPLPASARRYRPWWANERDGTHIHARAWLDAGHTTSNVDLNAETVEFVR